jgi:DNA-directed RNA polymerase specialized sigma24 family protein
LNALRSRRRRREDPVEEVPARSSSDSVLDALEVRQLVQAVLAEEDERTQACLLYTCVDGMTQEEVGDLLGISGAAVRKRLSTFRARWKADRPTWLLP